MYTSKVYEMAVDSYGDVRTLVRGLPYQCPDDWEEVLDSLDENSNLYLVKEPDNPKDKLAIAAYLDDRRIGYVAASDNGKIWLYMTDEKMSCQFIERFEASFKIAFENPRSLFEDIPFEEIYRDKLGLSEQYFPKFDIPFLNNPKDNRYIWFDDKTRIVDMEKGIPDFRRKLAARMIIIVGRKNNLGEYCYYLPYMNRPISDIYDRIIQDLIDKYGFVIALPDVPMITHQGIIVMDLHVTYLSKTNYKDFNLANQSELVFSLTKDYDVSSQMTADNQTIASSNKKYNSSHDIAIDGKNMFMQDSHSTPSYSKTDYILEKGEVTNFSIDKSTFIKIDKITTDLFTFVRQTLFPSTELFSYLKKRTPYHDQFFDFGQFETLIRVFVIKDLGRIYKGLNHSFNFDTREGKPLFLYMDKEVGETTDIFYEVFAQICDPKNQHEAAVKMRKLIEDITKSFYEYDIALWTDTDFMIHSFLRDVNNEWAKRYMELMRQFASAVTGAKEQTVISSTHSAETNQDSFDIDEQDTFSIRPSISEEVFSKFISDNIGCDVFKAPNSSWKYDTTDFLGNGTEMFETYIFKKTIKDNPKCKEIKAIVPKGDVVNFALDIKMNKKEIFDFLYKYKKLFFPNYTMAKCKKEYGNEEFSIFTEEISPSLIIRYPFMGNPCSITIYTSFCNKDYINKQKAKKKFLTLEK